MPHSSGGGSHGGGSHGGSHSHHSSGGGGGGHRSTPRVSTTRYAGSQRYVYYGRNRRPHYIYCSKNPRKSFRPRWFMLIFYFPFLWGLFMVCKTQLVHVPHRIDANKDSNIVISDGAGVIDSESAMEASLRLFYDETGVTPAVVTMYNDEWQGHYKFLEKYAYDRYLNMFHDEYHWLVVYSIPREPASDDFTDWYWEGMIGNNVSRMVDQKGEDYLTNTMQRYLTASSRYSVDEAIIKAFADTLTEVKRSYVNWDMIPMILFVLLFVGVHMMFMVGLTPRSLKYWRAKPAPEDDAIPSAPSAPTAPQPIVIKCRYCDSTYTLRDADMSCPNCGAKPGMDQIEKARLR